MSFLASRMSCLGLFFFLVVGRYGSKESPVKNMSDILHMEVRHADSTLSRRRALACVVA